MRAIRRPHDQFEGHRGLDRWEPGPTRWGRPRSAWPPTAVLLPLRSWACGHYVGPLCASAIIGDVSYMPIKTLWGWGKGRGQSFIVMVRNMAIGRHGAGAITESFIS